MDFSADLERDPYLAVAAGLILLFTCWGAAVSRSCQSDGCIGLGIPLVLSFGALAIQVLVLVPIYAFRRWRADGRFIAGAASWIGVSIACFILPLLVIR